MKLKALVTTLAVATMAFGVTAMSYANSNIANLSAVAGLPTDYTFTGGVGGQLMTSNHGIEMHSSGPLTNSINALFFLDPITEITSATPLGPPGSYTTAFSGGTFELIDNLGTGPTLLSGTFTGADLFSTNGSSGTVLSLGLNQVAYGPTDQYTQEFLTKYGGTNPVTGNFTLALSAINPQLTNTGAGGGLAAFNAEGSGGTFDAQNVPNTVVPEPGQVVTFAVGGVLLLGLMGVARRRASLQI